MDRTSTSLGLGLALGLSMLMPLSAYAYLTPEQVFGGSSTVEAPTSPVPVTPPPTQREGDDIVRQQQQRAAERREAEYQNLERLDNPPVDTYVPTQQSQSRGLFDENVQYENRQERLDELHGSAPTIIIGGDATVTDSEGNVLHSGAPRVSATGPESILAAIAMGFALISTFVYASIRSRMTTLA